MSPGLRGVKVLCSFIRKTVPYLVCTGAQKPPTGPGRDGDGNGSRRLCANRKAESSVLSRQSSAREDLLLDTAIANSPHSKEPSHGAALRP